MEHGRLVGYWPADFLLAFGVALGFLALLILHYKGRINLVECVTSTDRNGHIRTDPRKLIEFSTWYVMILGFVYLAVQSQLTEWYVVALLSGATITRYIRDREQRLHKKEAPDAAAG